MPLSRSELWPLPPASASFVILFRTLDDAIVGTQSYSPCDPADVYHGWPFPSHLSLRQLQRDEKTWDPALPTPPTSQSHPAGSNFPQPPFPKTETTVFERITAWIQDGRCSNSVGAINLKQAAYLFLVGAWLQATLNRAWGFYYCPSTISGIVASRRARNWQNFHHQLRRRPLALLSAFFHPAGCFHSSGRTSSRRTNSARRFGLTF